MDKLERIEAKEVEIGDFISTRKKGPYRRVVGLSFGSTAVAITTAVGTGSNRIRPLQTTKLWREA